MPNSNEYMNAYMKRRYARRRAFAIILLGGRCVRCGTTKRLEFDHIDPKSKKFAFGKIWSYNWKTFRKELRKAQLLCAPCHWEKTAAENPKTVEHGGGLTGKRNCRCDLCGPLKRAYALSRKTTK